MARSRYKISKKEDRTYKGVVYASKVEMEYFKEVVEPGLLSGEISKCETQVHYLLQPAFTYQGKRYQKIDYVADYVLYYPNGEILIVDTKLGKVEQSSILKRKLMMYKYNDVNYVWLTKYSGEWMTYEEAKKREKEDKKKAKEERERKKIERERKKKEISSKGKKRVKSTNRNKNTK